ncbi:MAG: hypothetical protein CL811_00600 [Colwelliaceae bacterium]|nr:hypothetical protein [Colwelliaceae bacterium]
MRYLFASLVFISVLLGGCSGEHEDKSINSESAELLSKRRAFDASLGTKFIPLNDASFDVPTVSQINFLAPEHTNAIWGAVGRDDNGSIYFGVSTHGGDIGTAYLYQYSPETDEVKPQSDVISQLKRAGLFRDGMRQNKLHSKFYQANDGYLYFSSFDETGEAEGVNPKWGGHLWRKKPEAYNWEHVLETDEALIAINTNGRYVYALGYWDHVLYQYDTQTNAFKQITVGSTSTHVSRNFIVDENGHAFVPSLQLNDFNELVVNLNHYDTELRLLGSYPMASYQKDPIKYHHGIIAYTTLENGDIYFTTSDGGLYQLALNAGGGEKLTLKGSMHEVDSPYIASLFPLAGKTMVTGLSQYSENNKRKYAWVNYETQNQLSIAHDIDINLPGLWGTVTKDDLGNMYVGGWDHNRAPVFLKLTLPSTPSKPLASVEAQ